MKDPAANPTCPRCGYDQSGAVAAWTESCPMEGVCSECGLGFAWRNLLNPTYSTQARLFEHAMSRHVGSFALTLRRTLRPWAFWSWVRMEHTIRLSRLKVFAALSVIAMVLVWAPLPIVIRFLQRAGTSWLEPRVRMQTSMLEDARIIAQNPLPSRYSWFTGVEYPSWPVLLVLAWALMPGVFLLLPETFRKARVRRLHLARIWAYSAAGLPMMLIAPRIVVMAVHTVLLLVGPHDWRYELLWPARFWSHSAPLEQAPWVLSALWLVAWWSLAAGRYLKLPRPWLVGSVLFVVAGLVAIGLVCLVPGGSRWLVGSM